jgi:hypothetical protein
MRKGSKFLYCCIIIKTKKPPLYRTGIIMTIAISLKVNDGVVLATDSAASIFARSTDGKTLGVINIYENADKVFNLSKGFPIGAITWGSGSIGNASISTLVKDFRKEVISDIVSDGKFSIEDICNKFSEFIYKRHYLPAFSSWERKPDIGFIIAGYGTGSDYAEEWKFDIINGQLNIPKKLRGEGEIGLAWNGEPEAITRLFLGYGTGLPTVLKECGIEDPKIAEIMAKNRELLTVPMVVPALPIQDAIDLAQFLVETTLKFSRFKPGAQTVGGPIDIAAITKHEGFKWVKRKHYYDTILNPTY